MAKSNTTATETQSNQPNPHANPPENQTVQSAAGGTPVSQPEGIDPSASAANGAASQASSTAPTPPEPKSDPSDQKAASGNKGGGMAGAGRGPITMAEQRAQARAHRKGGAAHFIEHAHELMTPGEIMAAFANAFGRLHPRDQFSELRVIHDHYSRHRGEIDAYEDRHRVVRQNAEDEEDRMADDQAKAVEGKE